LAVATLPKSKKMAKQELDTENSFKEMLKVVIFVVVKYCSKGAIYYFVWQILQ